MANPESNKTNKQRTQSITNQQSSGSEYHREHAGKVEGYGEPYPESTKTKE